MSDPYDLVRFVDAQSHNCDQALSEMRSGRKRSHWMWYVFPQYDGLGSSPTARRFAIRSLAEADAYLRHPILGARLMECAEAVLAIEGRSAHEIFDSPDDLKLRSSATLFSRVASPGSVFHRMLDRYFAGQPDHRTLELIGAVSPVDASRAAHTSRMPSLRPAHTLAVSIAAPASIVYAFLADPRQLPRWARGLGAAPTPLADGAWRIETPAGPMRVTFAPANAFGVVDHVVGPLGGGAPEVDVPLRVVPNGDAGSEVMLTLFQQPGMSDARYAADAALVQADLDRLKGVLEGERTTP